MNTRAIWDKKYNESAKGAVRTTRQYHKSHYGELDPDIDTFDGADKEAMYKQQNGECACCHQKLPFTKMQTDHISPASRLNKYFLQLLCKRCNLMKRDLVLAFAFIEAEYNMGFLQLFKYNFDWTVETFELGESDVKRIAKRVAELGV